tara:strand:+ start:478 stop:753 length:276 start_codon:yes stop_codon:yes gene_type:complete
MNDTKRALRHALSILKQIDFSSIPNINYDDIQWDWLDAACDEDGRMTMNIRPEDVSKLGRKGIGVGECLNHGEYFLDVEDSPCPSCEDDNE